MSVRSRFIAPSLFLATSLLVFAAPGVAQAAVPDAILAVAGPLAEHYGVSGGAVTNLLEKGVSLEGVTQLLLVKEESGKSFDQVTDAYRKQGDDILKTADQLGVAAGKYSEKNVKAAIDRAKADATEKASEQAAESAGKAVDSLLGGMNR